MNQTKEMMHQGSLKYGKNLECLRPILQNGRQLLHISRLSLRNLKTPAKEIQKENNSPSILK